MLLCYLQNNRSNNKMGYRLDGQSFSHLVVGAIVLQSAVCDNIVYIHALVYDVLDCHCECRVRGSGSVVTV